jgi:hypothetical protein
MTKTPAEFLEELEQFLAQKIYYLEDIQLTDFGEGMLSGYKDSMKEIKQFKAEQKQVGDEKI